jgi:peptide/nickel transport system substrate-binding protein
MRQPGRVRLATAAALAAAGTALLAAAAVDAARTAPAAWDGELRVDLLDRSHSIDPGLNELPAVTHATQLTLLGYPDRDGAAGLRLVPEAAGFPRVSRDGRTYTFTVRRGFRFSDGTAVTAAHFAHALQRAVARHHLPEIVGAAKLRARRAPRAPGVRARGPVLEIRLTRPAPDFLSRIALPHVGAAPLSFPIWASAEQRGQPLHSAGPYYVREHGLGNRLVLVRNPFWRRSLLPRRPARADRITIAFQPLTAEMRRRVDARETDVAQVGADDAADLHRRYGLRGRFRVAPTLRLDYLAFNDGRPLFRGNVALKRAVNFALDRPELARRFGHLAGRRTDQILPPQLPGFRDHRLFPLAGADLARARRLAEGHLRGGKATLIVPDQDPLGRAIAGIVKLNLAEIGLEVEVVESILWDHFLQTWVGRPDAPYDMIWLRHGTGHPDPSSYVDALFDGRRRGPRARINPAVFDVPAVNRKIEAASRLSGERRREAYARLELEIMRDHAPVAPFLIRNERTYYGPGVGCWSFHPLTQAPNLATLCKGD